MYTAYEILESDFKQRFFSFDRDVNNHIDYNIEFEKNNKNNNTNKNNDEKQNIFMINLASYYLAFDKGILKYSVFLLIYVNTKLKIIVHVLFYNLFY